MIIKFFILLIVQLNINSQEAIGQQQNLVQQFNTTFDDKQIANSTLQNSNQTNEYVNSSNSTIQIVDQTNNNNLTKINSKDLSNNILNNQNYQKNNVENNSNKNDHNITNDNKLNQEQRQQILQRLQQQLQQTLALQGNSDEMIQELNLEKNNYTLQQQWEQNTFFKFQPEQIINFQLKKLSQQQFVETVDYLPCSMRLGFFLSDDETSVVNLVVNLCLIHVVDPHGKYILSWQDKHQAILHFNATLIGDYVFLFDNSLSFYSKQITMAFQNSNVDHQDNLFVPFSPNEIDMRNAYKTLKELISVNKITSQRHYKHIKTILRTHKQIFLFTIFETLAISCVTTLQIYYIKNLLQNKMIV